MQNWKDYITAVNQQSLPAASMPQVAPYETSSSAKGKTGFMDLIEKQPEIQARYDAMKGTWEGPEATEKAVLQGLFKSEHMPIEEIQKQNANKK